MLRYFVKCFVFELFSYSLNCFTNTFDSLIASINQISEMLKKGDLKSSDTERGKAEKKCWNCHFSGWTITLLYRIEYLRGFLFESFYFYFLFEYVCYEVALKEIARENYAQNVFKLPATTVLWKRDWRRGLCPYKNICMYSF